MSLIQRYYKTTQNEVECSEGDSSDSYRLKLAVQR